MEDNKGKIFLLIDSNSVLHRTFHALPAFTNKKGEPTGALYGFLSVLWKVISRVRPEFIVACYDYPGETLRHKKYKKYKAKRPPIDPALRDQIERSKEILKILKIPFFEKKGFEADDLIGTLVRIINKKYPYPPIKIKILSGDLDLLQLVKKNVTVLLMKTGEKEMQEWDREKIKERYNLLPEQIVDFKALRGDPSDNIPGVSGIGEKTAISLLNRFQSVEGVYSAIEERRDSVKEIKEKTRKTLLLQKEQAFLSKSLAKIKDNINLDFNLQKCRWGKYDEKEFLNLLRNLGFKSFIQKFEKGEFFSKKEEAEGLKEESFQGKIFT